MAKMHHKNVDARRSRRRRYINAVEPFRQQFNCTAAQVHGIINEIMRENARLKGVESENKHLKEKIQELESQPK